MPTNKIHAAMKNLFFNLSLFFAFSLFQTSFAQQNVFSKIIFQNYGDGFHTFSMATTTDDDYILVGEFGYKKGIVIKVNNEGEILWNNVFQQTDPNHRIWFNSIVNTYDSCFLIAGVIRNESAGSTDAFYTKINTEGDTLWSKSHSFNGISINILDIEQTNDSGFIMIGHTNEQNAPYHRVYTAKIDSVGNLQWAKIFSVGDSQLAYSVKQMQDNSFIIAGHFSHNSPYEAFVFLLNLSPDGEIVWDKKYQIDNSNSSYIVNDIIINENSIIVYYNIGDKAAILETDLTGEVLWTKTYDAYTQSNLIGEVSSNMINTSDGGYAFIYSDFYVSGGLVKIDENGDVLWSNYMILIPQKVLETSNHEYFVIGNGPLQGVKDYHYNDHIGMIQVDSLGNGEACVETMNISSTIMTILSSSAGFSVESGGFETSLPLLLYSENLGTEEGCVDFVGKTKEYEAINNLEILPNPNNGKFAVKLKQNTLGVLIIMNSLGQIIYESKISQEQSNIDLSNNPRGVYYYQFTNKDSKTAKGEIIICD
jgi:hypothetical protein